MERENYNKIYNNASGLIDSAVKIVELKHYGIAVALLVLALEELVKFQVVLETSAGREDFSEDEFNKIFRNHKTKHSILKEFARSLSGNSAQEFYNSTLNQILNSGTPFQNGYRFSVWGSFLNCAYKEVNLPEEELKEFIQWLDKADDMKKSGFYVDYSNSKWGFPSDIKEPDYTKVLKFVKSVYAQISVMKDLDLDNDEWEGFLNEEISLRNY